MNRLTFSGLLLAALGLVLLVVAQGAHASTRPHVYHATVAPDGHAAQFQPAQLPSLHGRICHGHRGGNCWWEAAVELDKKLRAGSNVRAELATVWSEYHGDFHDTWADDNAWWGILWKDAARYGSRYPREARTLWSWDQHHSWSAACGGAIRQYPGGPQNAIAEASYAVLGHMLGHNDSARRAAHWIFTNLQQGQAHRFVSIAVDSNCNADPSNRVDHPALGAEVMSYKAEALYNVAGKVGARASAIAKHPDKVYDGVFNIEFDRYIG